MPEMTDAEFCSACEALAPKVGRPPTWRDLGSIVIRGAACPESVAAALWERHLRIELRKKNIRIYEAYDMGFCILTGIHEWEPTWAYTWYDDYRSALLAAVAALENGK